MVKRSSGEASSKPTKRAKIVGPKFYAVRTGMKPGIYNTWAECQRQIDGYPGAVYKSFAEHSQAADFVAGKNPIDPNLAPKPTRYYAVARGNATGIFTSWADVEEAIAGAKGPKYKKFDEYASAIEFIEEFGDADTIQKVKKGPHRPPGATTSGTSSGKTKLPTSKPAQSKARSKSKDLLPIYTDGSSRGNGKTGATAGYGVYFGSGDARNVSERLKGEPQTNQRAELTAILRALEIVPAAQDVEIFTDSQYSINCVTVWYKSWKGRGWKTVNGDDVKNLDLVKATRERIEEREEEGGMTTFTFVKGHADDVGNNAADALAVAGAKKPSMH